MSPGDPADGPGGAVVGAPDGVGGTVGRGVAPLVEGAAELLLEGAAELLVEGAAELVGVGPVGRFDADGPVALPKDRAALDGAVVRVGVLDELVGELATWRTPEAGTAVPCSAELQAAVTATSAAASAARTAQLLVLLIARSLIARSLIARSLAS